MAIIMEQALIRLNHSNRGIGKQGHRHYTIRLLVHLELGSANSYSYSLEAGFLALCSLLSSSQYRIQQSSQRVRSEKNAYKNLTQ